MRLSDVTILKKNVNISIIAVQVMTSQSAMDMHKSQFLFILLFYKGDFPRS